jgi:Zn-dependent peptidase ImmA (M78 family)
MGITWDKWAGDSSKFAFRMTFHNDPDSGEFVDADTASTWGSFQLWVNGKNLCAHSEESEHVDSVSWYLLPLLEWLVLNWDPLLHEERLPNANSEENAWALLKKTKFVPPSIEDDNELCHKWESNWQTWRHRHSLRTCRDGGLFPDVIFRRWRDEVEVSWGHSRLVGMPQHYSFVSEYGLSRLSPQCVAQPLYDVLHSAVEHLVSLSDSQRIRQLQAEVKKIHGKREQRVMWLAGFGIEEDAIKRGWRRIKNYFDDVSLAANNFFSEQNELVVTGSCHAALMFGTLSPSIQRSDAVKIAHCLIDLSQPAEVEERHAELIQYDPIDSRDKSAWEQAYDFADDILTRFNLPEQDSSFIDISQIIVDFGVYTDNIVLSDENIRGIAIAGKHHKPSILINSNNEYNKSEPGTRFTLAHELCHLLHDRSIGKALAMASGPWAPSDIEKRANAFAAMLLMPPSLITRLVSACDIDISTFEGICELAKISKNGWRHVLMHLHNLGYLDEDTKNKVESEATKRVTGEYDEAEEVA